MTCIGLFGTCGKSTWRKAFVEKYESEGIEFFNPQVGFGEWHPGMVDDENRHLAEDEIILFPVTDESTGQGSLAEIGFSIQQALRMNRNRYFVFLIDDDCNDPDADEYHIKDSINSRKLVKSKLTEEAKNCHNVFLVESVKEMLDLSMWLHTISEEYENLQDTVSSL